MEPTSNLDTYNRNNRRQLYKKKIINIIQEI